MRVPGRRQVSGNDSSGNDSPLATIARHAGDGCTNADLFQPEMERLLLITLRAASNANFRGPDITPDIPASAWLYRLS
jgi:hypothetical protein